MLILSIALRDAKIRHGEPEIQNIITSGSSNIWVQDWKRMKRHDCLRNENKIANVQGNGMLLTEWFANGIRN
jgi:hypothetical protein